MKTKEELAALKNQVETLNMKLAELTDEELFVAAGGTDRKQYVRINSHFCYGFFLKTERRGNDSHTKGFS